MLALGFAAALLLGATACSSVPDEANPAEWFGEDKPEDTAAVGGSDEDVPGAESDFPNLASVPPKPEAMTTLEERQDIAEGLVADRARAKYSDPVSRQAPVTVAPPAPVAPAPAEVAAPAPAPSPAPAPVAAPAPKPVPAPVEAPETAPIPPAPRPAVSPAPMAAPEQDRTSDPTAAAGRSATPPPVRSVTPPAPPPASPQAAPEASGAKDAPGAAIAAAAAAEAKASEPPTITAASPPPAPPAPAAATPSIRPSTPPVAPPAPQVSTQAQTPAPIQAPARPQTTPTPAPAPAQPQFGAATPPLVPSATVGRAEDAMFLIESGSGGGGASVVAEFMPVNVGTGRPVALIYFGNGSANLSARDKEILSDVAQLYLQRGGGKLRVVGHASSSVGGSDPVKQRLANFKISVDRSSAVARSLTDSGVPAGIVEVDAVSDNAPLLEGGEAADRRVEIYLN